MMKRVKLLLALCALLLTLPGYAQRADDPIVLNSDFNDAGDLVISALKRELGTFSLAIDFLSPQNLIVPSRFRTAIRSNGTVTVLKHRDDYQNAACGLMYTYILGGNDAKPNLSAVYRLPYAPVRGGVRVVSTPGGDEVYFRKAPPKNRVSFYFYLSRGDTVYAARKGRVVDIADQFDNSISLYNNIHIEHADGTISSYRMLESGSVMVRLGEMVYPDTPIVRVGSFDGKTFRLGFYVYYIRNADPPTGNAYSCDKAFESAFVNPVFSTSEGNQILESGKAYQASVASELIASEMTKREIKERSK